MTSGRNCKTLGELYVRARAARLDECSACPRSASGLVKKIPYTGIFALGCGFHQKLHKPEVMFVWRDPSISRQRARVGCEDGHVCPWCHDDDSAKSFRALFDASLGQALPLDRDGRRSVFCTNAVLHGPLTMKRPDAAARRACSSVLEAQVRIVRPRLLFALGKDARDSVATIAGVDRLALWKSTTPMATTGLSGGSWVMAAPHPSPRAHRYHAKTKARFKSVAGWL